MKYKYNKLRGRVVEKFGTLEAFSKKLDITASCVSQKLNGRIAFTHKDMVVWSKLLAIPLEELKDYFFA